MGPFVDFAQGPMFFGALGQSRQKGPLKLIYVYAKRKYIGAHGCQAPYT
jgi:hypothetical protein